MNDAPYYGTQVLLSLLCPDSVAGMGNSSCLLWIGSDRICMRQSVCTRLYGVLWVGGGPETKRGFRKTNSLYQKKHLGVNKNKWFLSWPRTQHCKDQKTKKKKKTVI